MVSNAPTNEWSIEQYRQLLDRIKSRTATDEEFDMVHQAPHQRHLSQLIGEEDAEWLVVLGSSWQLKARGAAWRLMRVLGHLEPVREHLRKVWSRSDLSDVERNTLLWRLLDDSELPQTLHRSIWDWIKQNRKSFVNAYVWYVNGVLDRYNNNHYELLDDSIIHGREPKPNTKLWIYVATGVLLATSDTERDQARQLMTKHTDLLAGTFFDLIKDDLNGFLHQK